MSFDQGYRQKPAITPPIWVRLFLYAAALLWGVPGLAVPPPSGVAPVLVPAGGFGIEGDLFANTPGSGSGDWLPGAGGAGGSVLDARGAPLNPATTFHFTDLYNTTSDNTFSGGKWTDDPNTWQWTSSKASSKTDINNVLLHVAFDANGHTWLVIAADRASTSGDSYIDFEFLQNTLTANSNGTFSSAGPNGGRTVNDMVLSLAFTSGGSVADFFAYRWLSSGSGFSYVDSTASLPVGGVFVAANATNAAVPFGAFGQTSYAANAFAEAAIDITALLGNFDPCLSIGVKTIMVKTKSSPSSTATIVDFINPIQYSIKLGPSATAGPNQSQCGQGSSTAFTLNGQATQGLQPIASTTWSVVSGIATIDSPASLVTTAWVSSASATLRLTVLQSNGCTETSDVVLTLLPRPNCSISGPASVCPKSTNPFFGPSNVTAYAWSISGNGSITGATNSAMVSVKAGAVCGATFTLTLTTTGNGCSSTCTMDVLANDTTPPTITPPADRVLECPADTRTNVTGVATAQDNCGQVTVVYNDSVTPGCGGAYTINRMWTATDGCGNSTDALQKITVQDTTAPVVTAPANKTIACTDSLDPSVNSALGLATATDTCSGVATPTYSDQTIPGNCAGNYTVKRTWSAQDACGNIGTSLQTITIRDTTAPVITSIPADVTVECPGAVPAANDSSVVATDNCSGPPVISHSDHTVPGTCANKFVVKRTYTATDACGNSSSLIQTITVNDDAAPVITSIPSDITIECASAIPAPDNAAVSATDNCGGAPVITHSDQTITGTCANKFVVKRTYMATDACGNQSSLIQTITINDDTAPVITSIPGDVTVECASAVPAPNDGAVVATDNCGGAPAITHSDQMTPGACVNKFLIKRTYTATDVCGNSSSLIQTITVNDDIAPVISQIPADVTVECASAVPAPNDGAVVATDNCGGTPVITHSDQTIPGTCANKFVVKRTYTATDACGNSSSLPQTITVNDNTAPVITSIPADVTAECASAVPAPNHGAVVATDNCGGVPVITHSDQTIPGTCANKFVVKRTYTATDACGNSSSLLQTITVNDHTAPTITRIPADVNVECASAVPSPNDSAVIATDNCGGAPVITHSDQTIPGACVSKFVIKRTYTATDACGNSSSLVQTITVDDETAPVITSIPADVTVQCASAVPAPNDAAVLASDNCGGAPVITHSDQTTPGICANRFVIKRTYTATDACGNHTSLTQTITVNDDTAPVITSIPADATVQCASALPAPNDAAVVATDNCGGTPVITHSDQTTPGICANKFVLKRTYTATDVCGNSSSLTQTITVNDNTGPAISSIPGDVTVLCASAVPAANDNTVVATDNCGGLPVITHSDQTIPGSCANKFVIKRSYIATDACGNSSSLTQTITVNDNTAPMITSIPADVTVQCASAVPAPSEAAVVATDTCGGAPVITHTDQTIPGGCPNKFVIKRIYTANDGCGNSSSLAQTITVNDTTPPTIATPPNLTLDCGASTTPSSTGTATAHDNCGSVSVGYSDVVTNLCGGSKIIIRTWTATDACGNSANGVQTISVLDRTPPNIWAAYPQPCTYSQGGWGGGGLPGQILKANYIAVFTNGLTLGMYSPGNGNAAPNGLFWQDNSSGLSALQVAVSQGSGSGVAITQDAINPTGTYGAGGLGRQTLALTLNIGFNAVGLLGGTNSFGTLIYTNSGGDSLNGMTVSQILGIANNALAGLTLPNGYDFSSLSGLVNNLNVAFEACTMSSWAAAHLTAPTLLVVQCPSQVPPPNPASVMASDSCSSPVTITNLPDAVINYSCPSRYTLKRTWVAQDACGNTNTVSFFIQVLNTNAPSLACPPNLVLNCPADTSTNSTGIAIASGACGPVMVSYSDLVTSKCGATEIITRNWTATDGCNSTSQVQTITVQDITAPSLVGVPIDATVQCSAVPAPAALTATDSCDSHPSVTLGQNSTQDPDPTKLAHYNYLITRTWTATDACGNAASASQKITVQDTTAPVLVGQGAALTISCPATPSFTAPTPTDSCDPNPVITFTDVTTPGACTGTYTITRTWTAKDVSGNVSAPVSQTITVQDTTPPIISCAVADTGTPSDYLGSNDAALGLQASYSSAFPSGLRIGVPDATSLFWEPTAAGLSALQTTLASAIAPSGALTQSGTNSTSTLGGGELARQTISLTLNIGLNTAGMLGIAPNNFGSLLYSNNGDSLDGATINDMLDAANQALAGQGLPDGYDFTSLANLLSNLNLAFQNYSVSSWAASHLSAPNVVVQCAGQVPAPNSAHVTATDGCSGPATITSLPDVITSYTSSNHFTITRSWVAIDACGNTNTGSYLIQVDDTTPPSLTISPNLTVMAGQPWSFGNPSAADNCSPVTVSVVNTVTNMANLSSPTMMVATRTWQAIDAAGNISTCQQSITVLNATPPALPVITRPPLSQIVGYGDSTTLTVTATSSAPLSYQWQFNGSDIAGATGSALPLTAMQFTNAGVYTVVVSNGGGAVTSPAAIIDVAPKLVAGRTGNGLTLTWPSPFILQSSPNAAGPYTDVASASSPYIPNTSAASRMFFRLRAPAFALSLLSSGGLGNLLVTGAPGEVFIIQGSTDFVNWTNLQTNTAPSTFVDTTAPPFMMRFYRVILAPLSAGAPVTLPSITAQPQSQTDAYGGSTTLSVSAAGSGPFAYQWFFDGNLIPGATGSSLSLSGLQFTNAGLYSVTVSNAAGTVTSQPAVVNVAPKLAAQTVGHNLTLTWPSPFVLQSAANPAGPYADVPGAVSPYLVSTTTNQQRFFRLRSAPFALAMSYPADGQARLDASGAPGWNFVIQASTDLANWVNLQTNTIPCTFVDSNASQYHMRFYRMISPP